MPTSPQEFVVQVIDKIGQTSAGDGLFVETEHGPPNAVFTDEESYSTVAPSPMAFEYPNNLNISKAIIPSSEQLQQGISGAQEGHFAVCMIHELLHRIQAQKPGVQGFFEAALTIRDLIAVELMIEAENYARTAQVAWRIAHDPEKPYQEILTYMKQADPENPFQSSYAIYVAYMSDKPITEEHELAAMRLVVDDFFFHSQMASRYATNRVEQIFTYLQSGRLQDRMQQSSLKAFREWMKDQPILVGLGPDAADCVYDDIIALSRFGAGETLDFYPGFLDKIRDPRAAYVFLGDEMRKKLVAIEEFSVQLQQQFLSEPTHHMPAAEM
jgi:hypothetical protein